MLRRIPRFLRVSVLVAVLLAVSVSVYQSWTSSSPGTAGWVQTQWGPLGPADRDLLVKVRLAGLWEQPTGQQAMQQANSAEVQDVGRIISTEHGVLDAEVRKVADQLGVLLPTSASEQQVAWMNEISAQTGADYDRVFIQRLREAHGNVLPVVAQARVGTRNELVRAFAETANTFVSGHIDHLEGSGLVNYTALPEAPSPGLFSGEPSTGDLIVPILVFVAALLGALCLVSALRNRRAERPRRVVRSTAGPVPSPAMPSAALVAIQGPRRHVDNLTMRDEWSAGNRPEFPGETTGPHRTPAIGGRTTDTGSHRVRSRTAPGETTGRHHAVRR